MNTMSAPAPSTMNRGAVSGSVVSDQVMPAPPRTTSTVPKMARVRTVPSDRRKPSRMAATGGMRVAQIAGRIAESRVAPTPTAKAAMIDVGATTSSVLPPPNPAALRMALSPIDSSETEEEADHRGDEPDDERLAEDRAEHLTGAGTHRPQQRHLADALAHHDEEGVEDQEAGHEERDEGEHQQHGAEDVDDAADVVLALGDDLLGGHRFDARRQGRGDGLLHGDRVGAVVDGDLDLLELAHQVELLLGLDRREGHEIGTRQRVGLAERERADQLVLTVAERGLHDDRVADLVAGGIEQALVEGHLVIGGGAATVAEEQLLDVVDPVDAERRAARGRHRLALGVDDERWQAAGGALGGRHAVDAAHLRAAELSSIGWRTPNAPVSKRSSARTLMSMLALMSLKSWLNWARTLSVRVNAATTNETPATTAMVVSRKRILCWNSPLRVSLNTWFSYASRALSGRVA